jgi:hemoglobin-like flavoprotein
MTVSRHPLSFVASGVGIPTDVRLVRALEESFALVRARCPDFGARFYGRLFAMCPHLRGMFPEDLRAQEKKLVDTLEFVITSLRTPAQVHTALRALGQRHRDVGVKIDHFAPVIACLVGVMGEAAGPDWTTELRSDWIRALQLVADAMMAEPTAPATSVSGPSRG